MSGQQASDKEFSEGLNGCGVFKADENFTQLQWVVEDMFDVRGGFQTEDFLIFCFWKSWHTLTSQILSAVGGVTEDGGEGGKDDCLILSQSRRGM